MVDITCLLLILSSEPERYSFLKTALPLGFLGALGLLTKHSAYSLLVMSLTAYFIFTYIQDRRKPSRASLLRFGCIILLPFIGYLIYNPSFRGLWLYIAGMLDLQAGYSDAMSTLGLPRGNYFTIGFLILLVAGVTAVGAWRKWITLGQGVCAMAAFFVGLKHGIVRADGHIVFTYAFAMIVFAILTLKWNRERIAMATASLTWAAVSIVSIIGMSPIWTVFSLQRWSPTAVISQAERLLQWTDAMTVLSRQTEVNLQVDRLPESLLARIGSAPVTIFPSELSYGLANGLNLFPLYTLQTYASYTNRLDRLAADRLLARTPPNARLLMEWNSIDGRHPLLDVPSTWMAIYRGYEGELSESNMFLLRKRRDPRTIQFRTLSQQRIDIRQWQDVPNRMHAVSASVSLRPTLWGLVRRAVYKTNPLFMEFGTDRGVVARFRAIPDVLHEAFIVNCLPLDGASLELLLFQQTCQQKVTRFRFVGEGLKSFSSLGMVAFAEAPDEHLSFTEAIPARQKSILENTNAVMSAPAWTGGVDAVNGRPFPITSLSNPVPLAPRQNLDIQGWAASNEKTGEAFERVYAVLGNQRFGGLVVLRPDVAKYYGNPRLNRAGFSLSIDSSQMKKGLYVTTLVGVTHDNIVYRCPCEIYVIVQ
jgi:hypothetical protein